MKVCIAEKLSLAEAAGRVLADSLGVKAEFEWDEGLKSRQYNKVGEVEFFWLDGHAFEQAMPDHYLPDTVPKNKAGDKVWRAVDLPIIPKKWEIMPKENKMRRLEMIAKALKQCSEVWHLGDPDEEGQVLVDECLLYYGYKGPVKRILINDYNATKVKAAIDGMKDNNEPMFRAWYMWGIARSHYDWLLGLNATRAMTLRGRELGFDGLLPVGSVQTPLLYIVRERDRIIENFRPIPYYTITALIKHENGSFRGKWKPADNQTGLDHDGRLIDVDVAKDLSARMKGQACKITDYSKAKKQEKIPLPLSMNELQMDGFAMYGYTGQQVLDAGQKLYEVYKVMSYPRSDNRYLSEAQHGDAKAIMAAVFSIRPDLSALTCELDVSRKSDAFNDKKMEGTPHHGLVPTIPENPLSITEWTEIERNIYDLVVRSYLAQFATPYEFQQTSIEIEIDKECFSASGRTPVSLGWKAVYVDPNEKLKDDNDNDNDDKKQSLPVMAKGDQATCEQCDIASQKTKPPERFDEGMFTECMKNIHKYVTDEAAKKRLKEGDGIGTVATRAPMITSMKDRQLFVPVKPGSKKVMTSAAARALIDALPIGVKDPTQAGVFKAELDKVARSKKPDDAYNEFMAETVKWVSDLVESAKTMPMTLPAPSGQLCPKCRKGGLKSKQGKTLFWYCSRWNADDKCDATYPDVDGKPDLAVQRAAKVACPACNGGSLHRKVNDKGAYWYCSNWNLVTREPEAKANCDAKFSDVDGKPDMTPPVDCPKCKTGKLSRKNGAKGLFWSCSNWKSESKCDAAYKDLDGKPQLILPELVNCPVCKTGALRRLKKGEKFFWACSNFHHEDATKKCSAAFPDNQGKPNFSATGKGKK